MRTTVDWREETNNERERERERDARIPEARSDDRTHNGRRLATVKFKSVEI